MSPKLTSRKMTLALAAAAALATTALASNSTYARGFVGGHAFGGAPAVGHPTATRVARTTGRVNPILVPRHPRPGHPIVIGRLHHPHMHWVFRGGRWIEVDDVAVDTAVVAPVATPVPGPCTCLTKTYTPTGLVVFADICTKESASAPALSDAADASQAPTTDVPANATPIAQVPTTPNYAGRTYQEYLAANPQPDQSQTASQGPQQTPPAPKQN
jgi:hypothetical protein